MKKALFLDFEDSFSFNIIQELILLGLEVDVILWSDFTDISHYDLLVLGPGPGHPDDYQIIFSKIESCLNQKVKIFAICLGHQIIWRIKGKLIYRSKFPLHGQKTRLELTQSWQDYFKLPQIVWVQRYNSLAVSALDLQLEGFDFFIKDDEIVISKSKDLLTYQFHPESMGTNCRESFFRPILTNLL
jgi:anthranilate/para-aminobenzoate synthase component II